jgi:hypothetical protein
LLFPANAFIGQQFQQCACIFLPSRACLTLLLQLADLNLQLFEIVFELLQLSLDCIHFSPFLVKSLTRSKQLFLLQYEFLLIWFDSLQDLRVIEDTCAPFCEAASSLVALLNR